MYKALLSLAILAVTVTAGTATADQAAMNATLRAHIRYADADLWADTITGDIPHDIQASGNVRYQSPGGSLTCDSLTYRFTTADFAASGSVRATFPDAALGEVTMAADRLSGNNRDGDIRASGNAAFTSKDRSLAGSNITYDLKTGKSSAKDDARAAYRHPVYGDILLSAGRIDGDLRSADVQAWDNVTLHSRQGDIQCDRLACDLSTLRLDTQGSVRATHDDSIHGSLALSTDTLWGDIGSGDVQAHGNVFLRGGRGNIRSGNLEYSFKSRFFTASEGVCATFSGSPQGDVTLIADTVSGTSDGGTITASGGASLTSTGSRLAADTLTYDPGTEQFAADGNVQADYSHTDYGETALSADRVHGSRKTGDLDASGAVMLQNQGNSLIADNARYNLQSRLFSADGNVRIVRKDADRGDAVLTASSIRGTMLTSDIEASGGILLSDRMLDIAGDALVYNFSSRLFKASGNVQAAYTNPGREPVTLRADTIEGSTDTGNVEAFGDVFFENQSRKLTGSGFKYNFKTDAGIARDASANVDGIYFKGNELRSDPEGYTITGARFTTCDAEDPHYYLFARKVDVTPGEKLTARHISMTLLGNRLLTLPRYSIGLDEEESTKKKLPALGVSPRYGLFAGYQFDFADSPRAIGALDVRLSSRYVFQGGLMYRRLAGRPILINATYRQPYYGGTRPDLLLSRLPEVGVRFYSGRNAEKLASGWDSIDLSRGLIDPLQPATGGAKMNIVGEVGAGRFIEEPDRVSSDRADVRLFAWLDPVRIGEKILVSPGVSARLSHYGGGDNYTTVGARLAVARRFGSDSYASLAWITRSVRGSTPFEFDQVELRDELAGRIRFPAAGFGLEVAARYDLRNHRYFDTEVSISRKFHCLEPKITWRDRFHEVSFGIGLVGF